MELPAREYKLIETFKIKYDSEILNPYELKYHIRHVSKSNPLYFKYITLVPNIETEIEINNIGRWLFGVKGYKGHYGQKVDIENETIIISIPNEINCINIIQTALTILVNNSVIKSFEKIN